MLGSFYYYKDQHVYREMTMASVDEIDFMNTVLDIETDIKDDSITQKLKNMFFER